MIKRIVLINSCLSRLFKHSIRYFFIVKSVTLLALTILELS